MDATAFVASSTASFEAVVKRTLFVIGDTISSKVHPERGNAEITGNVSTRQWLVRWLRSGEETGLLMSLVEDAKTDQQFEVILFNRSIGL